MRQKSEMHEARFISLDERHAAVRLIGGKGPEDPGWYVRVLTDDSLGYVVGPYDTFEQLNYEWQQSHRVRAFGFVAQSALLMEQVLVLRPQSVYFDQRSRVDDFVKIEGGEAVLIGQHVHIASFCHINIGGGKTIFEEGSSAASGVRVISGSNMPDAVSCSATAPIAQQRVERKTTRICKNATLYTNVVVAPGVTVGEGARILPGAVVRCDIPAHEMWGGIPARPIKNMRTGAKIYDGGRQ